MDARCRIELLGELRARRQDHWITRFETRQSGALLAYLAYYRQRPHPRVGLIARLWPDLPEASGRRDLRKALFSLRRQLEPPGVQTSTVIHADRESVQLDPDLTSTDVGEFEAALRAARRAPNAPERARHLVAAVELYRGELLPGYFEEWIMPERQRLAGAVLEALQQLLRLAEERGDFPRALEYGRRLVAADPLHEEGHHELIRLLLAAGQPAAARRQYQELERLLAQELGAEPDPETRALLQEIKARSAARPSTGLAAGTRQEEPESPILDSRSPASSDPPVGTVAFLMVEFVSSAAESTLNWDIGDQVTSERGWAVHRAALQRELQRHSALGTRDGPHSILAVFARSSEALAAAAAGMECVSGVPYSADGEPPDTQHEPRATVRMALHTGEVEADAEAEGGAARRHTERLLLAAHPGQILCSAAAAALLRRAEEPGKPGYPLADLGVYRLADPAHTSGRERLFQVIYPGMPRRELPAPRGALPFASPLPLRVTRFFGREAEIARLLELLGQGVRARASEVGGATDPTDPGTRSPTPNLRLVTLTGPGGSGKSRLALEVADRLLEPFGGAVWFVPLADLTDARLIPAAVRDALRLPRTPHLEPLEQVVDTLSQQRSLLVLDNFEHLLEEGADLVMQLLERVPGLAMLVTSRHLLGLEGEQEFPLTPLPVPVVSAQWSVVSKDSDSRLAAGRGPQGRSRDETTPLTLGWPLTTVPSIRLFIDRAQAARPAFQLTAANAAVVAALCARLEGLPLAVELAAARSGTLTPRQMLEQLEHRFQFLVSRKRNVIDRHRSLEATLDWSYRLLSPELRRFLARLSVFRGGFTLEAAERVCGDARDEGRGTSDEGRQTPGAGRPLPAVISHPSSLIPKPALDGLQRLRECSLVMAEEGGGIRGGGSVAMRYRLLETLREYAQEHLERGGEADAVRRAHAGFFLALAEEAEPHLWQSEQQIWLDRLEREHDNLRAALDWAVERQEGALAVRLAGSLAYFWEVRGYWTEGRDRLARILAMPEAAARTVARSKALLRAGWLAHALADFCSARRLWEECLAIARAIGDQRAIATALTSLGKLSAWPEENPEAARAALEESLAIRRELGDRAGIASTLDGLGNLLRTQGDFDAAWRLLEESVALRRELGDRAGIAWSLRGLGIVAYYREEFEAASAHLTECLALFRELGYHQGMALALESLWASLHRLGDVAAAHAVLDERLSISQELGSKAMMPQCLEDSAIAAQASGELRRAALLLAAAGALRETLGISLTPSHRASLDHRIAEIRTALGEAAFAAAWTNGRGLSVEQAVRAALEAVPGSRPPRRG